MSSSTPPPLPPRVRSALRVLAAIAAALVLIVGVTWCWYRLRPRPAPVTKKLFNGVTYVRDLRSHDDRTSIVHLVTIDVRAPGIGFLVTPGDPARAEPLAARTTSDFLREFHVQVAINGDFFSPWRSNGPLDYYPHRGDHVAPDGLAASNGVVYAKGKVRDRMTLRFSRDHRPSFKLPLDQAYNAISGEQIVFDGNFSVVTHRNRVPEPRTVVAMNRDETKLWLVVVDGRQPGFSDGMTTRDMIDLLMRLGAHDAMSLDGGGSSALVMEGDSGAPVQLNAPVHARVPYWERPVANHLGVFAKRE